MSTRKALALSIAIVIVALLVMLGALVVSAQSIIMDRAEILETLTNTFSEAPISIGIMTDGNILEVLASPNGSTWTIIVSTPSGLSGMMITGKTWSPVGDVEAASCDVL